ncbi:3196_t:CDS:2 [Ambispora leptoticha]|uniref:CENP-C homolog n=1 Tax=Ambispora leptoticha TaxID=144679 RepID=A0A9N8VYN0_9GLOM|nr:3196_t:CDS:2 [Ambispora leptoticha]
MPSDNAKNKRQRGNKYTEVGIRGRVTSPLSNELIETRKTGITVKNDVRKDNEGFDDLDDFFRGANRTEGNNDLDDIFRDKQQQRKKKVSFNGDGKEEPEIKNEQGLRRSTRRKIRPLKFWKNEKVVYGRAEEGSKVPVPIIKEIITISDNEEVIRPPLRKHATSEKRATTEKRKSLEIVDWETDRTVTRQIIFVPSMFEPNDPGYRYKFQKTFSDGQFFSSGLLVLPEGVEKPAKNAKDSSMVFYVIKGKVTVTIHKTTFRIASGGQFLIPRGNQYRIVNENENEAKLFFSQAREWTINKQE